MYTAIFDTVKDARKFTDSMERVNGKNRVHTQPIIWDGKNAVLKYDILPKAYDDYKKFVDYMRKIDG